MSPFYFKRIPYLYGTPTDGENTDDDENEPGDPTSSAPALGAGASVAPEFAQHEHIKNNYQYQRHRVGRHKEDQLEAGPIVLGQNSAGRQIFPFFVYLLKHVVNLRTRDTHTRVTTRSDTGGDVGLCVRRTYLAVNHQCGHGYQKYHRPHDADRSYGVDLRSPGHRGDRMNHR